MAEWMKVEKCTPTKPEIFYMSENLDMDPDAVFGKLFRVWSWFDDHTTDGHALRVTIALLDRHVGVTGFAESMIKCGWLAQCEDGIYVPNFERHNGETGKRRAMSSKRSEKYRAEKVRHATVTPEASPDKIREDKRREEKKREEESKRVTSTPKKRVVIPPIPDDFSLGLAAAADTWLEYKRERGDKLTPSGVKMLYGRLRNVARDEGESTVVDALGQAISNGWVGWDFPDRRGRNGKADDPFGNKAACQEYLAGLEGQDA